MTIAGDLDIIVDMPKTAHERVQEIFRFLAEPNVVQYLKNSAYEFSNDDIRVYYRCIECLAIKCVW